MSSQPNAWHTARGNRQSQSSSRTPQNRSSTASPSQANAPSQPPKHDAKPPTNVWAQRSAAQAAQSASGSNGSAAFQDEVQSINGFNSAEVKAFLSRQPAPSVYKPQDAASSGRASGGAWGAKANQMANGQPFFAQLAKQVASFQEGG